MPSGSKKRAKKKASRSSSFSGSDSDITSPRTDDEAPTPRSEDGATPKDAREGFCPPLAAVSSSEGPSAETPKSNDTDTKEKKEAEESASPKDGESAPTPTSNGTTREEQKAVGPESQLPVNGIPIVPEEPEVELKAMEQQPDAPEPAEKLEGKAVKEVETKVTEVSVPVTVAEHESKPSDQSPRTPAGNLEAEVRKEVDTKTSETSVGADETVQAEGSKKQPEPAVPDPVALQMEDKVIDGGSAEPEVHVQEANSSPLAPDSHVSGLVTVPEALAKQPEPSGAEVAEPKTSHSMGGQSVEMKPDVEAPVLMQTSLEPCEETGTGVSKREGVVQVSVEAGAEGTVGHVPEPEGQEVKVLDRVPAEPQEQASPGSAKLAQVQAAQAPELEGPEMRPDAAVMEPEAAAGAEVEPEVAAAAGMEPEAAAEAAAAAAAVPAVVAVAAAAAGGAAALAVAAAAVPAVVAVPAAVAAAAGAVVGGVGAEKTPSSQGNELLPEGPDAAPVAVAQPKEAESTKETAAADAGQVPASDPNPVELPAAAAAAPVEPTAKTEGASPLPAPEAVAPIRSVVGGTPVVEAAPEVGSSDSDGVVQAAEVGALDPALAAAAPEASSPQPVAVVPPDPRPASLAPELVPAPSDLVPPAAAPDAKPGGRGAAADAGGSPDCKGEGTSVGKSPRAADAPEQPKTPPASDTKPGTLVPLGQEPSTSIPLIVPGEPEALSCSGLVCWLFFPKAARPRAGML